MAPAFGSRRGSLCGPGLISLAWRKTGLAWAGSALSLLLVSLMSGLRGKDCGFRPLRRRGWNEWGVVEAKGSTMTTALCGYDAEARMDEQAPMQQKQIVPDAALARPAQTQVTLRVDHTTGRPCMGLRSSITGRAICARPPRLRAAAHEDGIAATIELTADRAGRVDDRISASRRRRLCDGAEGLRGSRHVVSGDGGGDAKAGRLIGISRPPPPPPPTTPPDQDVGGGLEKTGPRSSAGLRRRQGDSRPRRR